jgi:hypothetical protein
MKREELVNWAVQQGWKFDRWGHLQKEFGQKRYRLKISRIAARYEVRTECGWVRLYSGYLKNLKVTPENKIAGMTR